MHTFQAMSDSELEVMEIIWQHPKGQITSAEVIEQLNRTKVRKPSTIWTFLGRLVDKGFLHATKTTSKSFYSPTLSKQEYLHLQTEDFLKTVHSGSVKSLFSALSGNNTLTKAELQELQNWLAEISDEVSP